MVTKLNRKQLAALRHAGTEAELVVEDWLKKRGYTIDYSHGGRKSNLPYDILATRGKERWVIDVKSGEKPLVKISNFERMIEENPGYNKIGLALVSGKRVYLLEYKKMTRAGEDAWETRRKNKKRS